MNSVERRAARCQRRQAKREEKRRERLKNHGSLDRISDRNALAKAARQATRGVIYKASAQKYILHRLLNVAKASEKLAADRSIHAGFICFNTVERGKLREIMSVRFSERVIHKAFNQEILLPVMERSLIYDNGASRKGKGTAFAIRRLTTHLRRHYRRHGDRGHVLKLDIKSYFASLDHGIIKERIQKAFDDKRVITFTGRLVDSYYEHFQKEEGAAEHKGLGLGSEVNQTIAISYLDPLDHYIKEVLRIKGYGRYNDDFYLIHESKEYLLRCLSLIRKICTRLKLSLNEKKVAITTLSQGFTFLKTRVSLMPSGKILKRPCRDSITRERRRLNRQKKLLEKGAITFEDVRRSYASWRGSMAHKHAGRTAYNMSRLFNNLFILDWRPSE